MNTVATTVAPPALDCRCTEADGDAPDILLQQFRVVLKAVKSHFRRVEAVTGIGGSQVWALSVVAESPGIGVSELARRLSVRQPTASVLVRHLVQHRMLETVPNPNDRRSLQLYATAAGQLLLQRSPQPFSGVLPKALGQLDTATQERMVQDMARLIQVMGADADAAGTPLDQL